MREQEEGEKNLGSNSVRGEHNRFGGGSHRSSIMSMEGISMISEVFNDREVSTIRRIVLE